MSFSSPIVAPRRRIGFGVSGIVCFVLLVLLTQPIAAQQPDSTRRDSSSRKVDTLSLDSLAARLARTDSALKLLQQQLAVESGSGVRLRSRVQLDLSARLVVNSSYTRGAVSSAELPLFATAIRAADGTPGGSPPTGVPKVFGMSMRQALLGASASVDSVFGATLLADFELDFFARGLDAAPPLFPEPRLRTARVFLLWPRTELMFGMDTPLISDLNPISLAGVAIPVFSGAGNLWNWLPQIRGTRTVVSRGLWALAIQGAMLTPNASERPVAPATGGDIGLASGRPALQSRVRIRRGESLDDRAAQGVWPSGLEIGIGAHRSWLQPAPDTTLRSWAVSVDWRASLGHGLEVRGEAYRGSMVRGLGGGAIGQNFGTIGAPAGTIGTPLTDAAGWIQLNAQPTPLLVGGLGCGTDRVIGTRADRRRNSVCAVHTTWRPVVPVFVSLEYRGFRTRYADGVRRAHHWNVAFGIDL